MRPVTILVISLLSALSGSLAVSAESGSGDEDSARPPSSVSLEEVVVTAQKVSADLEKTAIAITALSPEQLERADVRSIVDLDKQVPGLAIQTGGAFPLNVTIRGVGYDGLENNSAQPGVAFFENGVYVASPLNLSASFLDLAQLEVLRGPQGTVNGQNADGGAINVTTGMPSLDAFHLDSEGSYGSYDYSRLRAVVNIPLGDEFAIRASVQREFHHGWLDSPDLPDAQHAGDEDAWMGRVGALWKPLDRFSVYLWGELFNNDPNNLDVRNAIDPINDPRGTSNDFPTPQQYRSRIGAATLTGDLDFATLKSITSYQHVSADVVASGDLLDRPEAIAIYGAKDEEAIYDREANSFTEELNLAHAGGALDWIVGAFYLHSKESEGIFEVQQSTPVRIPYTPTFDPTPEQIGELYGEGLAFVSDSHSRRASEAIYGQATWHLTPAVRLTEGLRYSWDSYTSETANFFAPPVPLESKFDKLTGKSVIEYDVVPKSTLYASFSTGIKPGGTNLNPGAVVVPTSFEHETVRAYELGSKNELFDRKLRLNLSAYYNDYLNLQEDSDDINPYGAGITNIPKSHVYGLETEVALILPAGFRIDANAAQMRSGVDSHFLALDPYTGAAIDIADGGRFAGNDLADRAAAYRDLYGNQLARVPHFSSSLGVTESADLAAAGRLDLFLQGNYRSRYWARIYNNPAIDWLGSQFTMNFNAHYQPRRGSWYAEFQITNLTGSNDIASRFADNFEVGALFDALVPPRQFIGRVGVSF